MEYCNHACSSNCRRNGCNCNCGEYHLATKEEQEKQFNEDREEDRKMSEKELFDTVYQWGRVGIKTDETSPTFQKLLANVRIFW